MSKSDNGWFVHPTQLYPMLTDDERAAAERKRQAKS